MADLPNIPALGSKVDPNVRRGFQALKGFFDAVSKEGGFGPFVANQLTPSDVNTVLQKSRPGLVNMAIPPKPENLEVTGAFNLILLQWDAIPYRNHSHTQVWRASVDDFGQAVMVGTAQGVIYADAPPDSSLSTTYYYWVRFVSQADVEGPLNATAGTPGATADDPEYVLELLAGEIGESQLLDSLNSRIDLIDTEGVGLLAEIQSRISGDSSLQAQINSLAGAISATVFVQTTAPVPGVDGVPDPIPDSSRWYDSDDNNHPYIWMDSAWQDLDDPRIGQNEADITALESSVGGLEDDVAANASAISTLDTTVTGHGTQLTAIASDVTGLQTDVGDNEAAIQAEQTARTDTDSALASDTAVLEARTEVLGEADLEGVLAEDAAYDTDRVTKHRVAIAESSLQTLTTDLSAEASARLLLAGLVDDNAAAVQSEQTARASADSALASDVSALEAEVGDPTTGLAAAHSAIQSEQTARASADSALASDISTVQATINNPSTGLAAAHAAVQTEASARVSADGTLGAEYAIKVNANGHIAGMGVAVSGGASGPISSEIIMLADKFAVVMPGAGEGDPTFIPFVVGMVDGVPKVVISEALIGDATIKSAHIDEMAVDDGHIIEVHGSKLAYGSIQADKYLELRNSLIYNGDDSLDASYPLEVPFLILSEMTAIRSVMLSFRILPYRGYATGASSGGGTVPTTSNVAIATHAHTRKIQGGNYSSTGYKLMYGTSDGKLYLYKSSGPTSGSVALSLESSDSHTHTLTAYYTNSVVNKIAVNYWTGTNTFQCNGSGTLKTSTANNHLHDFALNGAVGGTGYDIYLYGSNLYTTGLSNGVTKYVEQTTQSPSKHTHSVTVPSHTHAIAFGIHEESNSPTISLYADNGSGYSYVGAYTTDKLNLNLTSRFDSSGWKAIKFTASARCRIAYVLECKLDITA